MLVDMALVPESRQLSCESRETLLNRPLDGYETAVEHLDFTIAGFQDSRRGTLKAQGGLFDYYPARDRS